MAITYSIIVPSYNGREYLSACLDSILNQDGDYELIVSDDHSTDGTDELLRTIKHPRLRYLVPPTSMSMSEHWEWALGQATGEWIVFVGQDDGLMPYFFPLADHLVRVGVEQKRRVLMSKRAYYFWPGCEHTYGNLAVSYGASAKLEMRNFELEVRKCLKGFQDYFELPAMYTSSLVHRSLVEEIRKKQNGVVFITHPQDANLVAAFSMLEREFIWCGVPLGWVGTSKKSAGLAVVSAKSEEQEDLKRDYMEKVSKSPLKYNGRIGAFEIGSPTLYLWGALLETQALGRRNGPDYGDRNYTKLVLETVASDLHRRGMAHKSPWTEQFEGLLEVNGMDKADFGRLIEGVTTTPKSGQKPHRGVRDLVSRVLRKFGLIHPQPVAFSLRLERSLGTPISLTTANQEVAKKAAQLIENGLGRMRIVAPRR